MDRRDKPVEELVRTTAPQVVGVHSGHVESVSEALHALLAFSGTIIDDTENTLHRAASPLGLDTDRGQGRSVGQDRVLTHSDRGCGGGDRVRHRHDLGLGRHRLGTKVSHLRGKHLVLARVGGGVHDGPRLLHRVDETAEALRRGVNARASDSAELGDRLGEVVKISGRDVHLSTERTDLRQIVVRRVDLGCQFLVAVRQVAELRLIEPPARLNGTGNIRERTLLVGSRLDDEGTATDDSRCSHRVRVAEIRGGVPHLLKGLDRLLVGPVGRHDRIGVRPDSGLLLPDSSSLSLNLRLVLRRVLVGETLALLRRGDLTDSESKLAVRTLLAGDSESPLRVAGVRVVLGGDKLLNVGGQGALDATDLALGKVTKALRHRLLVGESRGEGGLLLCLHLTDELTVGSRCRCQLLTRLNTLYVVVDTTLGELDLLSSSVYGLLTGSVFGALVGDSGLLLLREQCLLGGSLPGLTGEALGDAQHVLAETDSLPVQGDLLLKRLKVAVVEGDDILQRGPDTVDSGTERGVETVKVDPLDAAHRSTKVLDDTGALTHDGEHGRQRLLVLNEASIAGQPRRTAAVSGGKRVDAAAEGLDAVSGMVGGGRG